jgi:hypothetical protein
MLPPLTYHPSFLQFEAQFRRRARGAIMMLSSRFAGAVQIFGDERRPLRTPTFAPSSYRQDGCVKMLHP